jgi:putative Mn2+ efflux pump MntP
MIKKLKIFIAVEVVLNCIGAVVDIMLESTLPEKMQEYIASAENIDAGLLGIIGLVLSFIYIVLLIISWIGLWKLWRPSRLLYTLCCFLGAIVYLAIGPVIYYSTIGAILSDYAVMASGIILCLLYFTSLKEHFKKNAPNLAFNSDG